MHRLQHASVLWGEDRQTITHQALLEMIIAGCVLLAALLAVALLCFLRTTNSLGYRMNQVLEAFMVIPQPVAKAMRIRSSLLLEKVLMEADAAEMAEEIAEQDGDDIGD